PDKFREVQWTYLPAGDTPANFVERVSRLLSPDDHISPAVGRRALGRLATATPQRPPRRRVLAAIGLVAVLPFENATGDSAIDYLSDGISECLINKLSRPNGLRVISRTSAFAFKGKKMEATEIGRKLGVDALVLGSLAQGGRSLTITAELVSVSDATQLWGKKYARPADDMMQVEAEIAAT